ncbi:zinc finger, CCHC-type containing protein [Tanacetum coccineum]
MKMYCDNTRAITIANKPGITKGAKHYRTRIHHLCEVIELGEIVLDKVHTYDNVDDPFTKALPLNKHSSYTKSIGISRNNGVLLDAFRLNSRDLNSGNRERTRLHLFQFSLRDQASNWLERLPAGSITTWEDLTTRFLAQFFPLVGAKWMLVPQTSVRESKPTPQGFLKTTSNWLEHLPAGSITTWEDLTIRFLSQLFPPRRTAKLRNDILMFQQHHGESLSKAWTRFKDLLQKVPHHGIDRWLKI